MLITLDKESKLLPVFLRVHEAELVMIGGGHSALKKLKFLLRWNKNISITVIGEEIIKEIKNLAHSYPQVVLLEKEYDATDLAGKSIVIVATANAFINEQVSNDAALRNLYIHVSGTPHLSNFILNENVVDEVNDKKKFSYISNNGELQWRKLTSLLIIAFGLMVIGHLIISYLPLPSIPDIWHGIKPHFNYQFVLFILAGFLAQMVDGVLSMGYGVTSATCLMSMGVNPVSVSAAIHTSEIFTTGISGYSHYRFGNVNKKLFKHLVVPGVIGAILGAVLLVYLGEKGGKWLMPVMATYALFLGIKILIKAFHQNPKNTKVKRVGWLAWIGGFLDSFGGGGWGPIVTSTLIAKGRSPKYTIGSVSLTEFFVTLASAFTFFITAGISHWNVVLGLLIGGSIAAPFAARLAGKLPKKTMMIAVGIMVIIWCIRMIIKSF
jgi:uncharacterized membrane protein YfcA